MGVLLHALGETAGDDLAHACSLSVLVGSCGGPSSGGSTCSRLEFLNVLLGDHATLSSALDGTDRDALLERELLRGRGNAGLALESGLQTVTGGFRLDSSRCGLGLGRRSGLGASVRGLAGLSSVALLGGSVGLLVTAGVLDGERLEGGDVLALVDHDSDGL